VTLLEEQLPQWHHREQHAVACAGTPDAVLAAFDALTWHEVPLFRFLMGIRSLGTSGRAGDRRILDGFTRMGFAPTLSSSNEIVYAGIGRPWSPTGGMRRVGSATEFEAFDEPGWARMAVNFLVADGRLSTETRVWLTSPSARRAFGAYWLVIRPFSGLVRRSWLNATVRRAGVIHRA
jgi:hypothetical protein